MKDFVPDFKIKSKLWLYPGKAGWYFVTIPQETSMQIKDLFGNMARGWGSLPVNVTIGTTTWKTSIFPDNKAGAYLLPVKAEIRKKEKIVEDLEIKLVLEILV